MTYIKQNIFAKMCQCSPIPIKSNMSEKCVNHSKIEIGKS